LTCNILRKLIQAIEFSADAVRVVLISLELNTHNKSLSKATRNIKSTQLPYLRLSTPRPVLNLYPGPLLPLLCNLGDAHDLTWILLKTPSLSATRSYPALSSNGVSTFHPEARSPTITLATPVAPIWRLPGWNIPEKAISV